MEGYYPFEEGFDWLTEDEPKLWDQYTEEESKEKFEWAVDLETGTVLYKPNSGSWCSRSITAYKSLRTRYAWRDEFPEDIHHWHDVVQIAVGRDVIIRLKSDGTVVLTDYPNYFKNHDDWCNIIAVATGWEHVVGLKADGTVKVYENEMFDENDYFTISEWQDITAISAGAYHTVGLNKHGTVLR